MCLWHILSVKVQTSHSKRAVSPEQPSLLSHMHKMGVHMTYFSVNAQTRLSVHVVLPEPLLLSHMYEFARALTALAHTQNGCVYGIFYQSRFKQALASGQSHQSSLHCSRTCAKWAYIWHILSVNAQMSLIVCAVLPDPSLLSHMHKMGVHITYFSVNAQTRLSVCAVLPEPSLLSHMHKMGVHMTYFSVNAQTRLSLHVVLPEPSLRSHIHKMGVFMAYFISQCSNKP